MAIKKSDFNKELNLLMSAQNEEEVLSILLKIIKIYNVSTYREAILSNPYFKMLIPELRDKVLQELNKLRKSIYKEIKTIDEDLEHYQDDISPDLQIQIDKLKKLRQDCMLLINEVDEKKSELENLL